MLQQSLAHFSEDIQLGCSSLMTSLHDTVSVATHPVFALNRINIDCFPCDKKYEKRSTYGIDDHFSKAIKNVEVERII
jgi:hypothetical protein